ncbi:MAG: 6-phosphofructokinase [Lachnospiraceae bacterium]|nr:6-phosphofructokinase [Lachnospiraceae bacterium]
MAMNVIVGQSGGPTAVINSSLAGVFKTAKELGADKVYGMRYGIQGFLEKNIIDMEEKIKTEMDLELLKRTPSAFLGSCRFKLPAISADKAIYEKIFEILKEYEIGAFFYIGGNDSMDTIKQLSDYAEIIKSDIRFIGVPKTIDNDLAMTDHTPGFGSAAKYIVSVTKELIRDSLVYDMKNVTIVEIMGRNAGWLTGAVGLAKCEDCEGVDLIYLPEVTFDIDAFLAKVKALTEKKKAIVVAVSEGIKTADDKYVFEHASHTEFVDSFGHKQVSGTARYLATLVSEELGIKARSIEFSTLQRCASHLATLVDITEAYQVGGSAVKAAFEGNTGMMVLLKRISNDPYICVTDLYDVHKIANVEKKVPLEWITEEGTNVSSELLDYIRPLIQSELPPYMVAGHPRHLVVDMI